MQQKDKVKNSVLCTPFMLLHFPVVKPLEKGTFLKDQSISSPVGVKSTQ